jgi:hypothetical protein
MTRITDPSNPEGKDWDLPTRNVVSRSVTKLRAHIKHDGAPALAQWAIYWARHKTTTMPTQYAEVRPIPYSRFWLSPQLWRRRHTVVTDCSGAGEIDASLAGVNKNPGGESWGEGNSSSFYNSAIERFNDLKKLKVGNYVAYGAGGDEHLVVVVAMKPEPMVVSHGMPGGPFLQPLSLDTRPRTFLRVNTRAKRVQFPPSV